MSSTRDRLLDHLKRSPGQTAAGLANHLEITPVAVRQHLARLEAEGLVSADSHAEGVGRPRKRWHLTEAADAGFPDRHENLTVELLDALRRRFGVEGIEALLAERTRAQAARYQAAMPKPAAALGHHVRALARIRSDEGYMATAERAGQGAWRLIEHHCPICAAATSCQGLCREELDLFRRILPRGTKIERTEHLLDGARRCVYVIQPRGAASKRR